VLPMSDKSNDYAEIRAAQEMKTPYMLIVGGRDRDARTVSVRHRTEGDLGAMPLDDFIEAINDEVESRGRHTVLEKMQAVAT
jgi:threonyl-tRNA synthetase